MNTPMVITILTVAGITGAGVTCSLRVMQSRVRLRLLLFFMTVILAGFAAALIAHEGYTSTVYVSTAYVSKSAVNTFLLWYEGSTIPGNSSGNATYYVFRGYYRIKNGTMTTMPFTFENVKVGNVYALKYVNSGKITIPYYTSFDTIYLGNQKYTLTRGLTCIEKSTPKNVLLWVLVAYYMVVGLFFAMRRRNVGS